MSVYANWTTPFDNLHRESSGGRVGCARCFTRSRCDQNCVYSTRFPLRPLLPLRICYALLLATQSSLQPLETISAFSEAAASQASSITPPTTDEACTAAGGHASEAARGCKVKKGQVVIDPMQQTYHLMSVQRMAEAKLRKLADPALAELAAQASRLGASSRTREIEHGPALVMHSLRRPRLDPTSISH